MPAIPTPLPLLFVALVHRLRDTVPLELVCAGRAMREQNAEFDFDRYRKLLAEANDEPKRLALINILIDERAKDRLAALRAERRRLEALGALLP